MLSYKKWQASPKCKQMKEIEKQVEGKDVQHIFTKNTLISIFYKKPPSSSYSAENSTSVISHYRNKYCYMFSVI